MTGKEATKALRSIGKTLGSVEDYIALEQAGPDLLEAALKDAREEWRRTRRPMFRWLRSALSITSVSGSQRTRERQ